MLRKIWLWVFGSYDENIKHREDEHQLILRMISEANAIAKGEWITDVGNTPIVIPERRRKAR